LSLVLFLGVGAVWKLVFMAIGLEAYSACISPVELSKVRMLWQLNSHVNSLQSWRYH